jgi:hypothetical protein
MSSMRSMRLIDFMESTAKERRERMGPLRNARQDAAAWGGMPRYLHECTRMGIPVLYTTS